MVPIEFLAYTVPHEIAAPYIPDVEEDEKLRTCVVLGSFGKFHDQILETIDVFTARDIRVLSPQRAPMSNTEGFQLLTTDKAVLDDAHERYPLIKWNSNLDAALVEKIYRETLKRAGFGYVVAPSGVRSRKGDLFPSGYGGTMMASEIGVAMGSGVPLYSSEPLHPYLDEEDGYLSLPHWRAIAEQIKPYTPIEMANMVDSGGLDTKDYSWCEGYEPTWPIIRNLRGSAADTLE